MNNALHDNILPGAPVRLGELAQFRDGIFLPTPGEAPSITSRTT